MCPVCIIWNLLAHQLSAWLLSPDRVTLFLRVSNWTRTKRQKSVPFVWTKLSCKILAISPKLVPKPWEQDWMSCSLSALSAPACPRSHPSMWHSLQLGSPVPGEIKLVMGDKASEESTLLETVSDKCVVWSGLSSFSMDKYSFHSLTATTLERWKIEEAWALSVACCPCCASELDTSFL